MAATKVIDSDVKIEGTRLKITGSKYQGLACVELGDTSSFLNDYVTISNLVTPQASSRGLDVLVRNTGELGYYVFTPTYLRGSGMSLGNSVFPWLAAYCKKFIVPDGTSSQFLKADGSLDETEYAPVANAWKLQAANAEVAAVVVAIEGNKGVFETMKGAGIDFSQSRNIYVDLSKAENIIDDIFAGYKELPVGVRYHIFFGNTQTDVKMNYSVESNLTSPLALTTDYPTAKCEFMRVTEDWTFADWEAKINSVSHSMDTGTLDSKESSTLQAYLDKQGIPYEKTSGGVLTNIGSILAALANGK